MPTELPQGSPIPDRLREAALFRELILFVGAGVSRIAGCPGWEKFANKALYQLVEKGKLTHSEFDQMKELNPRVKLSIAGIVEADTGTAIDYTALLPGPESGHQSGLRLYSSLFALGDRFVTTNYDRWLDNWIPAPVASAVPTSNTPTPSPATKMHSIYKVDEFLPSALSQPNTVVHLHGSIDERSSMVLTTRDYIGRYTSDDRSVNAKSKNVTLDFLEYLFGQHYTVLFIGYGLEEWDILEYVIRKASQVKKKRPAGNEKPRHFMLQGFFSHQTALIRHLTSYYAHECDIQLIDFSLDYKGYEQLISVLEDLKQAIPKPGSLLLRDEQELEDLAKELFS